MSENEAFAVVAEVPPPGSSNPEPGWRYYSAGAAGQQATLYQNTLLDYERPAKRAAYQEDRSAMMTEDQKQALRIGKLDTVMNVSNELARLYRHARKGKIETIEAFRLAGVLNALRQCLEASVIEQRIAELEATVMGRPLLKVVSLEEHRRGQCDPQAS